ncbi:MAG: CatB-related O-acetyltransferase [Selenomonadaceae bacterium]|nr:CatB-related O-acetyltransferase [Selenomonadaceae bacterium]
MNYTFGIQGESYDRVFYLAAESVRLNTVELGTYSYINSSKMYLFADKHPNDILIGRYSSISFDVNFLTAFNHVYKNSISTGCGVKASTPPHYKQSDNHYQIIIGSDVWIGVGATIMGGVKIASGAIIGTKAMVTKDVPPYAIVAGNPARIIRYRFDADTIKKLMAIRWWNWGSEKLANNEFEFYNPKKFLAEHYTEGLGLTHYAEIGGGGHNWNVTSRKAGKFIRSWQIFAQCSRSGKELSAASSNRRKKIQCCYSGSAKARRRLILTT